MSWTEELYKIYVNNCGRDGCGEKLLPISHSTANAQIEITLSENGDFVDARALDKSEQVTVIPVTEDSGSRGNGVFPMPFDDKLVYIAGDYGKFATGKNADNAKYFSAYMQQLKSWRNSENSHPAVKTVCTYLDKACIMQDLIDCGVLKTDGKTEKLDNSKMPGISSQEDAFVRFRVNYDDMLRENRTWLDESLYNSFIAYNNETVGCKQLCYATGEILPCTYKHPSKIRNAGDKAKLISANDESGFTYRGRFSDKEEALSVSYDFSQKMHNALKWLIARQGMSFENSLTVVVWASALEPLPDIRKSFSDCWDDEYPDDEEIPYTQADYESLLSKMIFGYKQKLEPTSKVMIMGLDAATTGRLSISFYSELEKSKFLNNIKKWHSEISWKRFNAKVRKIGVNSFSVYEIARCAYGTEQNGEIKCKAEIMTDTIMRLIPCITQGRKLPKDIMSNLFIKASNPLAYDVKGYNHRLVLEVACGIIRKYNIENEEGVTTMDIDYNSKDRSYLFGCLLAVADKAEYESYDADDKGKRVTNAKRYWNKFAKQPYRTWEIIYTRLIPYFKKLGAKASRYEELIGKIKANMSCDVFSSPESLEPSYLLGYYHQLNAMYPSKKEVETKESQNTEED